jgi:hypothetical protein
MHMQAVYLLKYCRAEYLNISGTGTPSPKIIIHIVLIKYALIKI